MKIQILFILFSLFPLANLSSQFTIDHDTIVPVTVQNIQTFEDFLVYLAWANSPKNRTYESEIDIAERNIKLAKNDWANGVQATFNLNEVSLNRLINTNENETVFLPIYNFGASVSLGSFLNNPQKTKIAKEELNIAKADLDQQKMIVRAEVLQLYATYLNTQEVLKSKIEAEENAYTAYLLSEQLLKKGEVSLNEYAITSTTYHNAQESKLRIQNEIRQLELAIAQRTGVGLKKAYTLFQTR